MEKWELRVGIERETFHLKMHGRMHGRMHGIELEIQAMFREALNRVAKVKSEF